LAATCRPYAFVEFDSFIQKTKKTYQDSRATQNLDKLNDELKDVTKVMTKNIEDLLYRGDSLEKMGEMSGRLREDSRKYKKAAVRMNWELLLKMVGFFNALFIAWEIFFFWAISLTPYSFLQHYAYLTLHISTARSQALVSLLSSSSGGDSFDPVIPCVRLCSLPHGDMYIACVFDPVSNASDPFDHMVIHSDAFDNDNSITGRTKPCTKHQILGDHDVSSGGETARDHIPGDGNDVDEIPPAILLPATFQSAILALMILSSTTRLLLTAPAAKHLLTKLSSQSSTNFSVIVHSLSRILVTLTIDFVGDTFSA
jgi:hypothetical protein